MEDWKKELALAVAALDEAYPKDAVCSHLGVSACRHPDFEGCIGLGFAKGGRSRGLLFTFYTLSESYGDDGRGLTRAEVDALWDVVAMYGKVIDEWNGEGCSGVSFVIERATPAFERAVRNYGKMGPRFDPLFEVHRERLRALRDAPE